MPPTHHEHPLARLEFSDRVRKRAEHEALTFAYAPGGFIVRNESYADPDNHQYRLTVSDGLPVACTCPADAHFDGACKHRVAVAMRPVLLELLDRVDAVTTDQTAAAWDQF